MHPVIDRTPQHAEHDPFLIALAAAEDLRPTERLRADELLASCRECAALAADLRSIASATAALPPRRAPRDFRLTDADAARLRRGAWRRRLGFLGSPRLAFMQPLGLGIATLGFVGVLLSGASLPFAASTAAPQAASGPAAGAPADSTIAADGTTDATNRSGESALGGAPASPAADALTIGSPEPIANPLPVAGASSDPSLSIMAAPAESSPAPPAPEASPAKAGASPGEQSATGVADGSSQDAESAAGADSDGPTVVPTGQASAEGGSSWTAWLALLLAGLALAAVRPIARLIARR